MQAPRRPAQTCKSNLEFIGPSLRTQKNAARVDINLLLTMGLGMRGILYAAVVRHAVDSTIAPLFKLYTCVEDWTFRLAERETSWASIKAIVDKHKSFSQTYGFQIGSWII